MTLASRLAVVAMASVFATGTAFAQTAAPAAKTDATTTTDKKAPKEHSAESPECLRWQAGPAKGLGGFGKGAQEIPFRLHQDRQGRHRACACRRQEVNPSQSLPRALARGARIAA